MVSVKVSTLSGACLDWAVAHCEGFPILHDPMGFSNNSPSSTASGYWVWDETWYGRKWLIGSDDYSPSRTWKTAGVIIDREDISLLSPSETDNEQGLWTAKQKGAQFIQNGRTALESAMRVYVMSVVGESIELPEKLISA
ncbi:phage protein NinX family protein [Vibrio sp. D431a]|uniref:phage protein NinX family protein n=1 Tax=Vibrio sp. D431a TaxID=2837388 RepID=UPI002554A077|nr:phage protein NinX family protein [Vibrio sp. D431a]MDK9793747.1 DUF2591 family protein [Vibrio sp. D431a]